MRLLRARRNWGLCPQTPRIYRFFSARMVLFGSIQGTGLTCPPPFRLLNRSLGLLPSRALSRPPQVIPEWTTATSPCNTFSANGDNPLNFVSHPRGSLQNAGPSPCTPSPLAVDSAARKTCPFAPNNNYKKGDLPYQPSTRRSGSSFDEKMLVVTHKDS